MFKDWAMGFAEIPEAVAKDSAIFKLDEKGPETRTDEERAEILLAVIERYAERYGRSGADE